MLGGQNCSHSFTGLIPWFYRLLRNTVTDCISFSQEEQSTVLVFCLALRSCVELRWGNSAVISFKCLFVNFILKLTTCIILPLYQLTLSIFQLLQTTVLSRLRLDHRGHLERLLLGIFSTLCIFCIFNLYYGEHNTGLTFAWHRRGCHAHNSLCVGWERTC